MKWIYKIERGIITVITTFLNYIVLIISGAKIGKRFKTCGLMLVRNYAGKGKIIMGDNVSINSSYIGNPIGSGNKTILFTMENGHVVIGNRVGLSNTAICSNSSVIIEDDVSIGSGVRIYDTDFHSIHACERIGNGNKYAKSSPILIKEKAFIGADCTILKGVTIGEESVIGAGSIVTCDIPAKEVWAGNPAKFIKKL